MTDSTNASVSATLSVVINAVPLVRLSGRVYPAQTDADLLTVTGQLQNVAASTNLSGVTAVLTIGGVSETFVLAANGSGTNADGSISISAKKSTFSARLKETYGFRNGSRRESSIRRFPTDRSVWV